LKISDFRFKISNLSSSSSSRSKFSLLL